MTIDETEIFELERMVMPDLMEEARTIAGHTINAYVKHDEGDFENSAKLFSDFFGGLFPEYRESSPNRLESAGRAYAKALWAQDDIEDNPALSEEQKLKHNGWYTDVRSSLERVCENLDIDSGWADETMKFFRYHGILRNSFDSKKRNMYAQHVLEANRILTERITGDGYWADMTGGLYLSCIASHDMHDYNGLVEGLDLTTRLVYIWLRGMRGLDCEYRGVKPLGGKRW
jgi:hypothetical protein